MPTAATVVDRWPSPSGMWADGTLPGFSQLFSLTVALTDVAPTDAVAVTGDGVERYEPAALHPVRMTITPQATISEVRRNIGFLKFERSIDTARSSGWRPA